MLFLLVLGIILIAIPVLGYIICACVFLYGCLSEDAPEGLFGGILASIGSGLVLLIIYFGLLFANR